MPEFFRLFPDFNPVAMQSNPTSATQNLLMQKSQLEKIQNFAIKHGYKNIQQFSFDMKGVLIAYAYFKLKDSESIIQQQLTTLPPEMKPLIEAQIKTLTGQIDVYRKQISATTLQAIEKKIPEIDKIMQIDKIR